MSKLDEVEKELAKLKLPWDWADSYLLVDNRHAPVCSKQENRAFIAAAPERIRDLLAYVKAAEKMGMVNAILPGDWEEFQQARRALGLDKEPR